MTGKQILFAVAVIFSCVNSAHAQNTWYGLLTVDKFPLNNCVVTEFSPLSTQGWTTGDVEHTRNYLIQMEKEYIDEEKRDGFNAILGFRVNSIRSGVGIGTVIELNGVAIKVKCK